MPKMSGKDLHVSFAGTSLGDSLRNFTVTEAQETADATAGADSYRNFVYTVKTVEASCEIVMKTYATGGSALRTLLDVGSEGTLIWSPEGTASGKPKRSFYAIVSQSDENLPFDDVAILSITFQNAGTAVTTTTW